MTDPLIPIPVVDPLELAWTECNDHGNALCLEALSGGLLKWVDDLNWIAFDGRRWSQREGGFRARMLAHDVGRHRNAQAVALGELIGDPDRPDREALAKRYGDWCTPERAIERLKALRAWAVRSGNATQTSAMLTQARDLPEMRAWSEDFDIDPLAFNVQNGTLFLRAAGEAVPGAKRVPRFDWVGLEVETDWVCWFREGHEPGDMIRQLADVAFDPTALCPQWMDRFVQVQPDDEQRAVLPILYGQSLTGLTDGEEFYTHQGLGGDGKSKTHEVQAKIFADYFRHAGVNTWMKASMQKAGSEHRSDLVRLAGDIRFVVSEEPPKGATWDSELIKKVTGGGNITARGSGAKDEITFKPPFKLHVEVNELPRAPSADRGWKRRQFILPWTVDTSMLPGGTEAPAALVARLLTEKSGILNWLIEGAVAWLALRRVPKPARVQAAVDSAMADISPINEWLAQECDLTDRQHREGATALYKAFKAWLKEQDEDAKPPSQRTFGDTLNNLQIYREKDRKGNINRLGIRMVRRDGLLGDSGGPSAEGFSGRSAEPTGNFGRGWAVGDDVDPFGPGDDR